MVKSEWNLKKKLENFLFTTENFFKKDVFFDDIGIKGSKRYRNKVISALQLLKNNSPENFSLIKDYLDLIVESHMTLLTIALGKGCLTLQLDPDGDDHWLAGRIWFYGEKTRLYCDYKKRHGIMSVVPKSEYSYEKIADQHYELMKELGCSYEELKFLSDEILKLDEIDLRHD